LKDIRIILLGFGNVGQALLRLLEANGAYRGEENAGQPFEIVPLDHPNRVQPGGALRLRVLLDGEPLAGVSVTGARASGPAKEISATTDERGEAAVTVTAPGRWYVRAIHMIHLEGDPEVSWASYWATLSFEVQSTAGSGY